MLVAAAVAVDLQLAERLEVLVVLAVAALVVSPPLITAWPVQRTLAAEVVGPEAIHIRLVAMAGPVLLLSAMQTHMRQRLRQLALRQLPLLAAIVLINGPQLALGASPSDERNNGALC
jgi:hypothetical protein